jgi:hypothetical protein
MTCKQAHSSSLSPKPDHARLASQIGHFSRQTSASRCNCFGPTCMRRRGNVLTPDGGQVGCKHSVCDLAAVADLLRPHDHVEDVPICGSVAPPRLRVKAESTHCGAARWLSHVVWGAIVLLRSDRGPTPTVLGIHMLWDTAWGASRTPRSVHTYEQAAE